MLRILEKYEIIEEIGHGGMATVFRARDTKLDRWVALKIMHPHLRGSQEARARFRREAQGVARLRHPCVLEIYDYAGAESDESYIATELLTGPTLRVFADAHPHIPAEIAACFAIEVCRALEAAHDKGIIHRDVKPENILVHEARVIKLTDFGIASMLDANTMTATGQILGSPGHMAPEQIEGKDCDARTDVFALGTVLYLLACGRLPFTGRNPHQVLKRIGEGDFPDPLRIQPTIGGRLRAILKRALAREPEARHPTARALADELRAFVACIGIEDASSALAEYLRDPAAAGPELRRRAVRSGLDAAARASSAGDVQAAVESLDRVLALDDGNPEALRLARSIGQRRRLVRASTAGSAMALLVGATGVFLSQNPRTETAPPRPAASMPSAARPSSPRTTATPASVATAVLPSVTPGGLRPSADDAGLSGTLDVGRAAGSAPRLPAARRGPLVALDTDASLRTVSFAFDPVNASIGVDGAPPRPYGPSFTGVELAPGPHRFVVESPCCSRLSLEVQVPAGTGAFPLARRLDSLPALLVVRTDGVPADVQVGGAARGRSNEAIRVPIATSDRRAEFDVVVTAPGRRPLYVRVRLEAGQPRELSVSMEPSEDPT